MEPLQMYGGPLDGAFVLYTDMIDGRVLAGVLPEPHVYGRGPHEVRWPVNAIGDGPRRAEYVLHGGKLEHFETVDA